MDSEEVEITNSECCKCSAPITSREDEIFPLCKKCEYDFLMMRG